jgi:hypothetical protein
VDAAQPSSTFPGELVSDGTPGVVGGVASPTVTSTALEVVAFPAASSATAVIVCDPFGPSARH